MASPDRLSDGAHDISSDTSNHESLERVIPALGEVAFVDKTTGRNIIRTSAYDGGKVFSTGFEPVDVATIFPIYDQ